MESILVTEKLDVGYDKKLINNIDLVVNEGCTYAILSPNNCGKTSLIKTLAGVNKKLDGEIFLNGKRLTTRNFKDYILNLGVVFEDYYDMFLCSKVIDELKYPLLHLSLSYNKIDRRIDYISDFLEIKNILEKNIDELTIFEKLKVSIGSSLIHNPRVLLLDDPFRKLNSKECTELLKIISAINNKYNIAVVFTTSDLNNLTKQENIIVIGDKKVIAKSSYNEIIKRDNDLIKLGIEIPIMVDLSRKLEFYKLVDKIYYDLDELVDALWK